VVVEALAVVEAAAIWVAAVVVDTTKPFHKLCDVESARRFSASHPSPGNRRRMGTHSIAKVKKL
jgi:hypothetical protein